MAVAFDNATTDHIGGDPQTWSHTGTGDKLAAVIVHYGFPVSAASYGGYAATLIDSVVIGAITLSALVATNAPGGLPTGSQTVSITSGDATNRSIAMTFSGVSQGVPVVGLEAFRTDVNETDTYNINVGATGMVVGVAANRDDVAAHTYTWNPGTLRATDTFSNRAVSGATIPSSGGSTAITWDTGTTPQDGAGGGAFGLQAPSAGNQGVWIFSQIQDFYNELKKGLVSPDLLQKKYKEVFI